MGAPLDLSGQQFGRLTAIKHTGPQCRGKSRRWECACKCGRTSVVTASALVSGAIKSCGCLLSETSSARRRVDLTGQRFGMLTVVARQRMDARRGSVWICRCDCGKTGEFFQGNLRNGHTVSCGCYRRPPNNGARKDYSGGRHGSVRVLRSAEDLSRPYHYVCACDCGTQFEASVHLLHDESACRSCALKKRHTVSRLAAYLDELYGPLDDD